MPRKLTFTQDENRTHWSVPLFIVNHFWVQPWPADHLLGATYLGANRWPCCGDSTVTNFSLILYPIRKICRAAPNTSPIVIIIKLIRITLHQDHPHHLLNLDRGPAWCRPEPSPSDKPPPVAVSGILVVCRSLLPEDCNVSLLKVFEA